MALFAKEDDMARWGLVGVFAVGIVLLALGAPAQAGAQGIVGRWLMRDAEKEIQAEFRADGRYTRSFRTAQQTQSESGTYRVAEGVLELRPDGSNEVVRFRISLPDDNRLIATDERGEGIWLARQTDAAAPPQPNATFPLPVPPGLTPAAPNPPPPTTPWQTPPLPTTPIPTPPLPTTAEAIVGKWLMRDAEKEIQAEFRADGRYSRSIRTAQQTQAESGTYQASQGILQLYPDTSKEVVRLRLSFPDANRLIVTDERGDGIWLARQTGAPTPTQPNAVFPPPVPPGPNPTFPSPVPPGPVPVPTRPTPTPPTPFPPGPAPTPTPPMPFPPGPAPTPTPPMPFPPGPAPTPTTPSPFPLGPAPTPTVPTPFPPGPAPTPTLPTPFPPGPAPTPTPPTPFPQTLPPGPTPLPTPTPTPGGTKQVQDPSGAFSFAVPADWQVQQGQGMAAAVDPTGQARVGVEAAPKQFQTLDQFAQWALATWPQKVPQWKAVGQEPIQVAGHPALLIHATGAPQGQVMMADYVLVLTGQAQVMLTAYCPQATYPQRAAQFQQIIQTLQVR